MNCEKTKPFTAIAHTYPRAIRQQIKQFKSLGSCFCNWLPFQLLEKSSVVDPDPVGLGILWPDHDQDRHRVPAILDPDPDLYPLQPNVKKNILFRKFRYTEKLKIMTLMTPARKIKTI